MGIELVNLWLKNIRDAKAEVLKVNGGENPRRASQVCVVCKLLELTGLHVKLMLSLGLWPESIMGEERGTEVV